MTEDERSADEDRTVFAPGRTGAPATSTPPVSTPPRPLSNPPRQGAGIQVGDVLNHIFEVRRFLARGGMGEVFEGVNVNSEERVAIKVMLPSLAADPNIQAMFRKEARTLTRLNSPALVQYRVLAQEPQLGIFYIVTEFIDGANLCDVLQTLNATPAALLALARRLADGLRTAHALGAIHRDISPDNVLLEDGLLAHAKIIDFGIAKDLDPGAKTVVGDGFAGKLGYVAPEQLGDFDRQVGPWTDVYSLGLVLLAVATGRNPDLGGSFVEAIDKRRRGVDLSDAPEAVRPLLVQMLEPDPAKRLRSMDEVLSVLDAPAASPPNPPTPKPKAKPGPKQPALATAPAATQPERKGDTEGSRLPLFAGIGVAAAALIGVAGYIAFGGSRPAATPERSATAPVMGPLVENKTRAAITRALPGVTCSWLTLTGITVQSGAVSATFSGAAGQPANAQATLIRSAAAAGSPLSGTDFTEVAPISTAECQSIDAFRAIRAAGDSRLTVPQPKFEMSKLPYDSAHPGTIGARVVVNFDIGTPDQDFALYGIEPSGAVSSVIPTRKVLTAMLRVPGSGLTSLGGERYRLQIDAADQIGWSGFLLLRGRGGFPDALILSKPGARPPDWARRFAQAAADGGWQADIVWFKMVDEVPN